MADHRSQRPSLLSAAIFWSVISAAFIGPGTITTAGKAGAQFGIALLWAIPLSISATIVLQEAAARLTISTGKNLGIQLREKFIRYKWIPLLIWICVAFGCAAYEAGNILGAVAGLQLILPSDPRILTVLVFLFAVMVLRKGDPGAIARILGVIVAIMGVAFIVVAAQVDFNFKDILLQGLKPSLNPETALLVVALVGTTIVPYNLFLGSRLGEGQDLSTMRRGLITAVAFGGIITISILLTGTLVNGSFGFQALADTLSSRLGSWATWIFAVGLVAAGLTSAVTAPLAAAITAQSIMPRWRSDSLPYRMIWMSVLLIGLIMGLPGLKPIPVIIGAQAINGVLLPTVVFFLFIIGFSNRRSWYLFVAWIVLVVVTFLGVHSLVNATEMAGLWSVDDQTTRWIAGIIAITLSCFGIVVRRRI